MRDRLYCESFAAVIRSGQRNTSIVMIRLTHLAKGQRAQVTAITEVDSALRMLLDDIGISEGAVISLIHRGVGKAGALGVQVGEAVFAVRYPDAQHIQVQPL